MKTLRILFVIVLALITSQFFAQGHDAILNVKIQEGHLNVRQEPSTDAAVVVTVGKDEHLLFQMEHRNGWLKVKYAQWYNNDDNVREYSGWVHSDFVESSYLSSTMLGIFNEPHPGSLTFQSIKGTILVLPDDPELSDDAYIHVGDKDIALQAVQGSHNAYSGEGFTIEVVAFQTEEYYEYWVYTGFLRIEKAGKVEYIFITGEFGA